MLSFKFGAIIPILIVDDVDRALRTAELMQANGLTTIELTLRTPHALSALAAIAKRMPDLAIGAGMVMRPSDVTAARNAGARFLTSPGFNPDLAAAGISSGLPYIPGAATASEVMSAREMGFSFLKFFPAREMGGPNLLRVYATAFEGVDFCPGGGVTEYDAPAYLALPNVPAINATWIAPADAIEDEDWDGIAIRARQASRIRREEPESVETRHRSVY